MRRVYAGSVFAALLAFAQMDDPLRPAFSSRVEVAVSDASTGRALPARLYLFKDGRPFRLSPVDAMLPLKVDLFYRERLWRRAAKPRTLEVTANDQSHVLLLDGGAGFDLPAGKYRLEAYRGLFWRPASEEFEIGAGQKRRIELKLEPMQGREQWLSADDHIHLTRAREDDAIFLAWLEAEDLSVGNFLQLQRQQDASVQYGFGERAEARRPGYSIRSGMEARSDFYGHVNVLGPRELMRPLSVGAVYANSPEAYPFPAVLFARARALGGTVGYAHFDGSQKNSALLMDVALKTLDFVEVFQFGVLKTESWYELLNAGFRVTGIAGSDFPVPLNNRKPWPRSVPLLGPERTLVNAAPGVSAYAAWAAGVRAGAVVVSNGPLLELTVNGRGPGAAAEWSGGETIAEGSATAWFHRPIARMEIVVNGKVAAQRMGAGRLDFRIPLGESVWVAARAIAEKAEDEPEIQAHTNPVYLLREGRPVREGAARASLAARWKQQAEYYRGAGLVFREERERRELLEKVEAAAKALAE